LNIQKRDVASVNSSTCSRCASAEQQRYDGSDSSSASLSLSLSLCLCLCLSVSVGLCVRVRWFNAVHSRTRQTLRRQCTFTPPSRPSSKLPFTRQQNDLARQLAISFFLSTGRASHWNREQAVRFWGHSSRSWGFCITFRFFCAHMKNQNYRLNVLCRNKIAATSSDIPRYGDV